MKPSLLKLLLVITLGFTNLCNAQDTVRLMTYNILNYPYVAATRADTLLVIIDDVLPDIFIVNELQNNTGANTILNIALNNNGRSYYSKAIFYNGTDSDNMCFYDNTKFGLASQKQIGTSIRDISEYVLYWKGNLPATDTIFFNVYSVHLKASSGATNEAQRFAETQILKARLDFRGGPENTFVGGDFNIYGDFEAAFTEIISGGVTDLNDPINSAGDWHINPSYANIHTQATGSINGGSGGGLDDRFDFFFVTDDIMNGDNHVKYIDNSYIAYGQDGNRYNSSLNVWPANTVVSPAIASALYNMSDHLPVIMEVVVDPTLSIEVTSKKDWNFFFSEDRNEIDFHSSGVENKLTIRVTDILGKQVNHKTYNRTSDETLNTANLKSGIYIASACSGQMRYSIKFLVR
jgi:hypothetical protein